MQTNKTIQRGEKLDDAAKRLLEAAYNYWEQYQADLGPSAVVWVEADNGHFILFTRSEYKSAIVSAATRECRGEEVMFAPFSKPNAQISGGE